MKILIAAICTTLFLFVSCDSQNKIRATSGEKTSDEDSILEDPDNADTEKDQDLSDNEVEDFNTNDNNSNNADNLQNDDAVNDEAAQPDDEGECVDGDTTVESCGINGNGTEEFICNSGFWASKGCQDPDICLNAEVKEEPCGENDLGKQEFKCIEGQWKKEGECKTPREGHWRCISNTCTPTYETDSCGDGRCNTRMGETDQSCPTDCNFKGVSPESVNCVNETDCIFLDWPSATPGYWSCDGFVSKECVPVETADYCGTEGFDYCGTYYGESKGSCPQDCQGIDSYCDQVYDCAFNKWPE